MGDEINKKPSAAITVPKLLRVVPPGPQATSTTTPSSIVGSALPVPDSLRTRPSLPVPVPIRTATVSPRKRGAEDDNQKNRKRSKPSIIRIRNNNEIPYQNNTIDIGELTARLAKVLHLKNDWHDVNFSG